MDEKEAIYLLVLIAASVLLGAVSHYLTRNFLAAVLATGVIVSLGVQLYLTAEGYELREEKFSLILVLYPAGVGFFASAIVGAVFLERRRRASPVAERERGASKGW